MVTLESRPTRRSARFELPRTLQRASAGRLPAGHVREARPQRARLVPTRSPRRQQRMRRARALDATYRAPSAQISSRKPGPVTQRKRFSWHARLDTAWAGDGLDQLCERESTCCAESTHRHRRPTSVRSRSASPASSTSQLDTSPNPSPPSDRRGRAGTGGRATRASHSCIVQAADVLAQHLDDVRPQAHVPRFGSLHQCGVHVARQIAGACPFPHR